MCTLPSCYCVSGSSCLLQGDIALQYDTIDKESAIATDRQVGRVICLLSLTEAAYCVVFNLDK